MVYFMLRLFRACLLILILCGICVLGAATLVLEKTPQLAAVAAPGPEDVTATRDLVRNLRAAAQEDPSGAREMLETDIDQLNSALKLGARFIVGFRGVLRIEDGAVLGQIALPVPWWDGTRWLNAQGLVPAFEGAVAPRRVTLGGYDIPPTLAVFAARWGANLLMGNRVGDRVLAAATQMQISGQDLRFRIALDDMGKNGVMRGTFSALRGSEMPGPAEVEYYHTLIRQAMAEGRLPTEGSFLPYIRFALAAALDHSPPEALANGYTAAIFGLAKACGAQDFALIVGRLAFDVGDLTANWPASCDAITFNGRVDSRRHFITSSALQAASNVGFSVSVGEFKELYDTISGAGGFDFTDMAANLSGIRMSDTFMRSPAPAWPALFAKLETEKDVIIGFEGIPALMPQAQFEARYGDVDSARYKEQIAQIEARIDALRLYQP